MGTGILEHMINYSDDWKVNDIGDIINTDVSVDSLEEFKKHILSTANDYIKTMDEVFGLS